MSRKGITLLLGDAATVLRELPERSAQCVVTSPPYWGLRDYGIGEQLGLEATPDEYVAKMVTVFREVRRVLRDDGTLWLNLGDSYGDAKQLQGIPWRVAFALQADGWYLRQDIIWHKPNPMPESVTDRCTKAHEYVFLLSKRQRYFYDADSVREPIKASTESRNKYQWTGHLGRRVPGATRGERTEDHADFCNPAGAPARTGWAITTQPYPEAHFATLPVELPTRCIKAGSAMGDTVLDPFSGAGTTGVACVALGREYIGVELNPEYMKLSEDRIGKSINPQTYRMDKDIDSPLFTGAEHATRT